MAQRVHCDVCGEEVKGDRGHVWANRLPNTHPMRSIVAKIEFFGLSAHGGSYVSRDICDDCFVNWLLGLGALQPFLSNGSGQQGR